MGRTSSIGFSGVGSPVLKCEGVLSILDFLRVLVLIGKACGLRERLWGSGAQRGDRLKGKSGNLNDMKIPNLKSNTIDVQKPKKRLSTEDMSIRAGIL